MGTANNIPDFSPAALATTAVTLMDAEVASAVTPGTSQAPIVAADTALVAQIGSAIGAASMAMSSAISGVKDGSALAGQAYGELASMGASMVAQVASAGKNLAATAGIPSDTPPNDVARG